jgi:hypothetical protein
LTEIKNRATKDATSNSWTQKIEAEWTKKALTGSENSGSGTPRQAPKRQVPDATPAPFNTATSRP